MDPRRIAKAVLNAAARGAVAPLVAAYRLETALLPGDRRNTAFQAYSQALAMVPGLTGQYLRRGFYGAVLTACHPDSLVGWATVFSTPDVTIAKGVYVGARCMIGHAVLEADVTIGSNVDILSGKNQHHFDDPNTPLQQQGGRYEHVTIGANTWLGNGAIVMADVGRRAVVAAGAVVVNALPDDVIAGGNPARVLKRRDAQSGQWVRAEKAERA